MKNDKFLEELIWARQHHGELLKKYRDEWVAIKNHKILAADKDLEKAECEAEDKTKGEAVAVYYVDSGSHIYAY